MVRAFLQTAADVKARTAIVEGDACFSYGDLLRAVSAVRRELLAGRTDVGETRVTFLVPAGFRYAATLLGIWSAGGIAVPLSSKHPLPELKYVVDDTAAEQVIVGDEFQTLGRQLGQQAGVPTRSADELLSRGPSPDVTDEQLSTPAGSRRAMILYTSGSTGRPKGVVTSHDNIAAQVAALVEAWEWSREDRILHVLPMHHIHGIVNVLLSALGSGATCEFAHPFDPRRTWQRMGSGELSLFMAVPTIYAKLIAAFEEASADEQTAWSKAVKQMRLHVSGSAALPVPVLEKWEAVTGQRLLERYGMTEIGMALSNSYGGNRRAGFVGRPLPGVEARRRNESGQPAQDDEPGEIEIRGDNVFLEYWNRPDETRASFRDGWFRTGDIAVVQDGDYRILGRSSVDIIKTGGYKVSALEIEDVLRTHPVIRDCAVVGVPSDEWGERVAVCVVLREPDCESLDLQSLREWGKQVLASYKVPSLLCLRSDLPRNVMGKVQKRRVQDLFE